MKPRLVRRVKALYQPAVIQLARGYRRFLKNTHIIGITGSCGKTSAKDFTATVLSSRLTGRKSYDTTNGTYSVARTLLAMRPSHDFCVQEVGVFHPGDIDRPLDLLRPTIGVITAIGSDHFSAFRGPERVAQEKRKLIDVLPGDGTAVLNIDDPHIAEIAKHTRARVISFGRSEEADVRATNVTAAYPNRLGFSVRIADQEVRVRTRLLGEHQLTSIMAAIAVAHAAGVPLAQAIRAVELCTAPRGRMELVETPHGVTFINDSYKAPYWTLEAVFRFMHSARATRKWLVIGHIVDHNIKSRALYRRVSKAALGACDRVVFIGPHAHHAPESGGRVATFAHAREADAFLHAELRSGDLVLVKGNNLREHLARLFLTHQGTVGCWREDCLRAIDCRSCRRLASS